MEVKLPLIPIRHISAFIVPTLPQSIGIGRKLTADTTIYASKNSNEAIVAYQKNQNEDDPDRYEFHPIGVKIKINKIDEFKSYGPGKIRAHVIGISRIELLSWDIEDGILYGNFSECPEETVEFNEHHSTLAGIVQDKVMSLPGVSLRPIGNPTDAHELSKFIDRLIFFSSFSFGQKIRLFSILNPIKRMEELHIITTDTLDEQEISQLEAESKATTAPASSSPAGSLMSDIDRLKKNIEICGLSPEAKKLAESELRRLQFTRPDAADFNVVLNFLETLVSLPWNSLSKDKIDIKSAQEILDADHYGLKKVKSRILEFLAVRKLTDKKGMILCFAGPPGTGKTSIGKSIARAIGRKFVRLSLGGISDEAEVRGHRRTYVGALPGKIIQSIKECGVRNPVFMLDEVDKIGRNGRGDVAAALLEVLDPEQNSSFVDNYISVGFDLSQVMFIATVNDINGVPPALRDRMDVIDISGYTPFDKMRIAKKYLLPKQKEENGISNLNIEMSDDALSTVVSDCTSEAGVRNLERECGRLMRKIAVKVASEEELPTLIDSVLVRKYLGPPKIHAQKKLDAPTVGISTGLAWTMNGGTILFIESVLTGYENKIEITGNLGDVMKESIQLCKSWINSEANFFRISPADLERSIHIHVPSGAIPKDGPSAGVAITVSLLSSLLRVPIRDDIAITGEISLRGRVLPVGGVREKILSAHRAGILNVGIPKDNESDLVDLPKEILEEMNIILLDDLKEAVSLLLAYQDKINPLVQ